MIYKTEETYENKTVVCLEDTEKVSYGFLGLKTKEVPIKGITKGEKYKVLSRSDLVYGAGLYGAGGIISTVTIIDEEGKARILNANKVSFKE